MHLKEVFLFLNLITEYKFKLDFFWTYIKRSNRNVIANYVVHGCNPKIDHHYVGWVPVVRLQIHIQYCIVKSFIKT